MTAKILIRKEKKEYVEELGKRITVSKFRRYYVGDISKDFHCSEGIISKKDLKKKDGSVVKTNTNKEFIVISPSFIDSYKKISRLPQIIPLKDIGDIVAETGINKNSIVIDCGSGSGALALFLAHISKQVVTYEIKEEHFKIVKDNINFLGLKNIKAKNKDVYKGIDEKNVDLVTLDLPSPWNAIGSAEKALKIGGFLVSYSPTIPQVADFVNTIIKNENFIVVKTVEIISRDWEAEGRKVRPKTTGIGHSGFLTFARKIK